MISASDNENPITTRDALTVSALNRVVAGLLSRSFPLVRVRGEIANLNRAASGHWYFTLKDAAAQVRCVMFRGRNVLAGFAPRDGDEVEILAQVGLYEARGEFQLNVESMQRAGLGRLYEEFMRRKARLAAAGLFDPALKRPVPALPRAIGVVTSLQAAALRDVLSTLARRAPYARLVVYPVPVQGDGSGLRIAEMLARVSARAEVDVVLLVRGGGSIDDLWAFNEEAVAYALRACAIPVVVGVGHESDVTIADFAADLRAPTPTAAAELVAPERTALLESVSQRASALRRSTQRTLETVQQRLDYAMRALAAPRGPLRGLQARLAELRARLDQAVAARIATVQAAMARCQRMLDRARPQLVVYRAALRSGQTSLASAMQRSCERRAAHLAASTQSLAHLDPRAVLGRGYSIVRDAAGSIVRNAGDAQVGAALDITFAQGAATVRVERTRAG